MLLTIVMAIWSLTSSQAKSDFPLVTKTMPYSWEFRLVTLRWERCHAHICIGGNQHGNCSRTRYCSVIGNVLQTTIKSRVDKHHSSERIQNLLKIEGSDEKLPKFVSHSERKLLLVCRLILVLFLHQELLVHLHPSFSEHICRFINMRDGHVSSSINLQQPFAPLTSNCASGAIKADSSISFGF